VYDSFVPRLKQAYASVAIGNPLDTNTLVGPLIGGQTRRRRQAAS
jgi:aldehyde dehydrogenase (NAD+)